MTRDEEDEEEDRRALSRRQIIVTGVTAGLGVAGLAWYVAGLGDSPPGPPPRREFRSPAPTPTVTLAGWRVPIVVQHLCTPLRSGDDLFLYDESGSVYALAVATGETTWKADCGISLSQGVELSGDVLLVAGQTALDGVVIALDRGSGKQVWRRDTAGQVGFHRGPRPGSVLVHDAAGVLLLLDVATGEVVWRSAFTSDAFHLFSVDRLAVSGSVVLETFGGTLRADTGDPVTHPNTEWFRGVDGADGTTRWTADVAAAEWTVVPHAGGGRPGTKGLIDWLGTEVPGFAQVVRTIAAPSGDPNFALSTTSELVGIDVGSGRSTWALPAETLSRPVIGAGAIYVVASSAQEPTRIHGLDARTGRDIWTFTPEGDDAKILIPAASSLAIDGDVLCAGSQDGILALDASTGRRVWAAHHGAHGLRGAPVASRDVVYMLDEGGSAAIRSWRLSDGRERPVVGAEGDVSLFLVDGMLLLRTGEELRAVPLGP
ncbi:hypothetical protein GCM10023194_62500 [Planotetraspora phitsanulokensis]|uniref:Pyrrolo-quinoline quinone repeat domain-containing protein n=1 Tax=Planotetraspora phitsanulokensis TaxID=575192 RepID=A0A8J3U7T5_9ACTN|nr:PQQ-binding-like beta-propeller repeat protein [Planotetraspora phitsanulokensis]GII37529.1 hypothetical protein Pph01_25320 [Planotetraspora phitsanulokensis]